jgi:hypothetical protein
MRDSSVNSLKGISTRMDAQNTLPVSHPLKCISRFQFNESGIDRVSQGNTWHPPGNILNQVISFCIGTILVILPQGIITGYTDRHPPVPSILVNSECSKRHGGRGPETSYFEFPKRAGGKNQREQDWYNSPFPIHGDPFKSLLRTCRAWTGRFHQ